MKIYIKSTGFQLKIQGFRHVSGAGIVQKICLKVTKIKKIISKIHNENFVEKWGTGIYNVLHMVSLRKGSGG